MSKYSIATLFWSLSFATAQTSVLNFNDGRFLIPSFAQGEVATIVLRTPAAIPDATIAARQKWPETLGGVRIVFTSQPGSRSGRVARIGSVRSRPFPDPGVSGIFTFVDFQVPFSLESNVGLQFSAPLYMNTFLGPDEIDSRPVMIVGDRIRLQRICDEFYFQAPILGGHDDCGTPVYREDDMQVRLLQPGDKLHVFAYGLGQTNPPTGDGEPFDASAAPAIRDFRIWIEHRVNAIPRFAHADEVTRLESAKVSVVPGAVGRYRIDFEIPPTPEGAVLWGCRSYVPGFGAHGGAITSNAALTIFGLSSLGGTGLCLMPNPPNPSPRPIPVP